MGLGVSNSATEEFGDGAGKVMDIRLYDCAIGQGTFGVATRRIANETCSTANLVRVALSLAYVVSVEVALTRGMTLCPAS